MIYRSWHLRFANFFKAMSTRIVSSDPVQHNRNMGEAPNSSVIAGRLYRADPSRLMYRFPVVMCVYGSGGGYMCVLQEKREGSSPFFKICSPDGFLCSGSVWTGVMRALEVQWHGSSW